MRWLLVTGAGASRHLGLGGPLPLMGGWAEHLLVALDAREPGLASAVGLERGMSSEEFEETIGALLRWNEMQHLRDRFRGLGAPRPARLHTEVVAIQRREEQRMAVIVDAINDTLYRLFSADRIEQAAAIDAYGGLLRELHNPVRLMVVTTNYDPSAEIGLDGLRNRKTETGFDRPPGRPRVLDIAGLVKRGEMEENLVPVLHLHGAVGWYESEGEVREYLQDQPYDQDRGRPVVLYPDPDKDPTRDAVVAAVWGEFKVAIAGADRILVVGHSLRDRALVRELSRVRNKQIGVGVFIENGAVWAHEGEIARLRTLLDGENVTLFPLRFGPARTADYTDLHAWVTGQPR